MLLQVCRIISKENVSKVFDIKRVYLTFGKSTSVEILIYFFCYINILAGAAQWLVVMAVLYISGACLYAGKLKDVN